MRPAFQFYPGDWRRDQALRLCSIPARGLWIEMMVLMHDCEPYGHLTVGGKAMTADQVARLIGEPNVKAVKVWMQELIDAGVPSLTPEGVIFSRRMVRDEALRMARAEGGKAGGPHGSKGASYGSKGGRPKKSERGDESGETETPLKTPLESPQGGEGEPPSKPPPSSSSSSSVVHTANAVCGDASGTPLLLDEGEGERKPRKPKPKKPEEQTLEEILGGKGSQQWDRFWKTVTVWPRDKAPAPKALAITWLKACTKADPKDIYLAALHYRDQFLPPVRPQDETHFMRSPLVWLEEEGWNTELVVMQSDDLQEAANA